jgi:tetratricopeptide (TPR) repeat protein
MVDILAKANIYFGKNELTAALESVNQLIQSKNEDLSKGLLLRARIHFRMQNWGDAINDFSSVLELDPGNQEAKSGIEMAKNILGYFTPDMFNP